MATLELPSPQLIRFGVFELDPQTGELRRQGVRVKLQEQSLLILLALLENPRRVVTREDLRKRIWPENTFVEFDQGLYSALARLRDALRDSAENPRFIETLPRRGYRFIAPIETVPAASPEPAATQAVPRKSSRRYLTLAATAAALLACSALLFFASGRWHSLGGTPSIRSVAVLPLENLSGDPAQNFFADAMTEALTTELARGSSLRVISRTSSTRYKETHKSLPEIAQELKVDAIVEGSVLRSGDQVRITADLVRADDDRHLWTETFERNLTDILRLQREVAQAIAQNVSAEVGANRLAQAKPVAAIDPQAYEAYINGVAARGNSWGFATKSALERSVRFYEEAIQKQPDFAPAHMGLAEAYMTLGEFRGLPTMVAYGRSKAELAKALALDDSLPRAQAFLANLTWRFDWDWQAADKQLREAIKRNPTDIDAHCYLAMTLFWRHRREEASSELAAVQALDPVKSHPIAEAAMNFHFRDYPRMLEAIQRIVETDADDWVVHYLMAVAYDGLHRPQEAIPEYRRAVTLSLGDQDALAGLTHGYVGNHQPAEANAILHDLLKQSKSTYVSKYMIAAIYASLDKKDEAFQYLDQAFQERSSDLIFFIYCDLRIDSLRSDPRFANLLARMGLPQRWTE
jgi:TolB-like protein/DNA-binding winged helix-turn-helix (wHTH) protein/Tfp pilus assembly protein PilF